MIFINTIVTSKEAILQICRNFVSENGLSSLNMRMVAQKCNVALGSLYNYFPSKSDLAIATIESVWQDIFRLDNLSEIIIRFSDYVQKIFDSVKSGMISYPNFFTAHSIGLADEYIGQARQAMEQYFLHIKKDMYKNLKQDFLVRQNAFDENFTESKFIDFVIMGMLGLLLQHKLSCTVLLEMICRALY